MEQPLPDGTALSRISDQFHMNVHVHGVMVEMVVEVQLQGNGHG